MSAQGPSDSERQRACHEAGHAVLGDRLEVGVVGVELLERGWGRTEFKADCTSDMENLSPAQRAAHDKNCFRLAVALYAGAEAARRAGHENWRAGADVDRHEDDYHKAVECINNITDTAESVDSRCARAQQRAAELVEHYWPEIEAVAEALLKSRTLLGDDVARIVHASITSRNAAPLPE